MSMIISTFLLFLSQSLDTLWTRTYGGPSIEKAYCIQETSDKGFILIGYTSSFGAGWMDFYIVKTDSLGNALWTRTYGGIYDDIGRYIQQTDDGGYICTGSTESFGSGSRAVWLLKINESGDTTWTKTFGWTNSFNVGYYVQQTVDGGYIIGGSTQLHTLLIKTECSGNAEWIREYGILGSSRGFSASQTNDGGYAVTGYFYEPNHSDFYFVKTNAAGDTLWSHRYGCLENEECHEIQQTSDGGYILVGAAGLWFNRLSPDVFLVKTDSHGDTTWTRRYGDLYDDHGYSVRQTSDGGYIIAGYSNTSGQGHYNIYLIRTDEYGDTLWTKIYGTNMETQWGQSVRITSDRGYAVCGWTTRTNGTDMYLLRLSPDPYGVEENTYVQMQNSSFTVTPNPFVDRLYIHLDIEAIEKFEIRIHDVLGRFIMDFEDRKPNSLGPYVLTWDGRDHYGRAVANGVYLVTCTATGYTASRTVLLMRD